MARFVAGPGGAIPLADKGVAGGVAELDSGGDVPLAQIAAAIARGTELTAHAGQASVHHTKGINNVAIGDSTRNSSGEQAISGLGFQPTLVIMMAYAIGAAEQIFSLGWSDGSNHHVVVFLGDSVNLSHSNSQCVYVAVSAGDSLRADIKSMDADGFTLDWTLLGTCFATFFWVALA